MTDPISPAALAAEAAKSRAWPFEEARKLIKRYPRGKFGGEPMLFETGYGPSGLPHIGTFNEVLRTTMVRRAYATLTGGAPTRLVAFSDDMDGLRKVPDNVPGGAALAAYLGKPLSTVPDPFGKFDSFAAHNNAMLRDFLDRFGFDYDFVSSTQMYHSGAFDDALRNVLRHNQAILDIMLPTLRAERRATYSPVLPVSPTSGTILQVPVKVVDADAGLIAFTDEDGTPVMQSALGGKAKLQWKVDWAMRWVALGVDYEMYGKDLTDSGVQSGKIAAVLGGRKPEGLIYEMFLDERGEKISKSKGNGLALEDWLTYAPRESVAFYAYREPKSAKQLHLGIIPGVIDDYYKLRAQWRDQPLDKQLGNPVHHVHDGAVPVVDAPVSFALLLNLAGVLGAAVTPDQMWAYLANYLPGVGPGDNAELDQLVDCAARYHRDVVAATLRRRAPDAREAAALARLDAALADLAPGTAAEDIQTIVYDIGKSAGFDSLRDWFRALYAVLLGAEQGPRMGSFIALYGIDKTRELIALALINTKAR